MTSELELHQSMKQTSIQTHPDPLWELFSNVMETNNYTHHNSWKCGTLKQIIQISIVFNKVEMKLSEFNSFFFSVLEGSVLEGCLFEGV